MANGDSGTCAGVVDAGRGGEEEGDAASVPWMEELGRLSRGQRTERRLVERARMVLSTLEGSIYAASRRFGCSKNTVRKWRDRFAQARQHHPQRPVEEALRDAERSGRPPEFSEAQLVALMSLATADPQTVGEPTSHWSCADLARVAVETGRFPHLSKSHVQRLLCRDRLRPHRHKMWLNRPDDPEYDERAATVTNLLCASSEVAQAARGAEKGAPLQPVAAALNPQHSAGKRRSSALRVSAICAFPSSSFFVWGALLRRGSVGSCRHAGCERPPWQPQSRRTAGLI